MARIRTVKPEFWTDEKVVECSIPARLLFIGLFLLPLLLHHKQYHLR